MRFRTFIVLSIAITIALGGYSIARVEHTIRQQGVELAQERLNACKFKLYDLAVGTGAQQAHLTKGPEYNIREARVIGGVLRVVQSIPSAQECIPVIRREIRIRHQPPALTHKIEHELIRLAHESPSITTIIPSSPLPRHTAVPRITVPIPVRPPHHPTHRHVTHTVTPPNPPTQNNNSQGGGHKSGKSKGNENGNGQGQGNGNGKPKIKTPRVESPSVTVPTITTPPVEVPPITVPSVEVGSKHSSEESHGHAKTRIEENAQSLGHLDLKKLLPTLL